MSARILVVEDDAVVARDLELTLEGCGYQVVAVADNYDDTLQAFDAHKPDLVLLDVRLRGAVDGISAASELRKRHACAIVYLSAFSDRQTINRAAGTGAYGYLVKPFSESGLSATIEIALEKRNLERRVELSERRYSTTLHAIGDAVIVTDQSEAITFLNPAAESVTGWASGAAIGQQLATVLPLHGPGGDPIPSPMRRAFEARAAVELPPQTLLHRGQAVRDVDDSAAPILNDEGQVVGGVMVLRDVTEKRELERRVSRSERLAAVGTLAAAMAHEINNPLSFVLSNTRFTLDGLERLERECEAPALASEFEQCRQALLDATEGGERIRRLVQDITGHARFDASEAVELEPSVLLTDALKHCAATLGSSKVNVRASSTRRVIAQRRGLLQVFVNLLVNAALAMEHLRPEARCISVTIEDQPRAVRIAVTDCGSGVAPAQRERLFQPFSSTRAVGKGTGLGLWISHNIVAANGGELSFTSPPGEGATFIVTLPTGDAV